MESQNINRLILSLDNNTEILNFKLSDGFAVWPQVRYSLYKELLNNKLEHKVKKTRSVKERLFSLCKGIKYYISVFSRSPLNNNVEYDYLIFNSSISCFKNVDGVSISKINHFFTSENSRRFLNIFQSVRGKYFSKYSEPYAYHEAVYLKSAIQAKLSNRTHPDDYDTILQFINFLKDEVGEYISGQFYNGLQNELLSFAKIHYYLVSNFNKLFKKTNPKFIIVEDGNYGGGDKTTLLWCANKLNIKSIEVQHGVFDLAYKYGAELVNSKDFSLYKTSLLLTMGSYWTDYSKVPSRVYQIGYPYLEEKKDNVSIQTGNSILFISQGLITSQLKKIAIQLADQTNYKIIYRLHPNEDINDYLDFQKFDIELSNSGDIYELIAECKAVVGSYSTVLFEALLFDKKIFIHNNKFSNEYIPKNLGIRFLSSTDLINNLETTETSNPDKNNFWSLNWKNNLEAINQIEKLW